MMNTTKIASHVWATLYPDRREWDQLEQDTRDIWVKFVEVTLSICSEHYKNKEWQEYFENVTNKAMPRPPSNLESDTTPKTSASADCSLRAWLKQEMKLADKSYWQWSETYPRCEQAAFRSGVWHAYRNIQRELERGNFKAEN